LAASISRTSTSVFSIGVLLWPIARRCLGILYRACSHDPRSIDLMSHMISITVEVEGSNRAPATSICTTSLPSAKLLSKPSGGTLPSGRQSWCAQWTTSRRDEQCTGARGATWTLSALRCWFQRPMTCSPTCSPVSGRRLAGRARRA